MFGREVIERFDQKVSKTFLFFEEIEFLSGVVLEDKRRSFFESESSREKMPDIYTLSSMLLESNVDDGVEVVAAKSQWQQKQETSKQGRFSLCVDVVVSVGNSKTFPEESSSIASLMIKFP